jgi:DNA polymerase III subunit delta'
MAFAKDRALERLSEAHRAKRLAHACLLVGPPGSGKVDVAKGLSALILGCSTDHLGEHPDFHQVFPESKSRRIVTSQIRDLEHALHMKALIGSGKVALIHDADRLQPQAANAFLKTLEEPPAGCHIILTTSLREAVIPTILSRCMGVPLRPRIGGSGEEISSPIAKAFEEALLEEGGAGPGTAIRFTRLLQAHLSTMREEITSGLDSELKTQLKQYRDSVDRNWKDTREDQIKATAESAIIREREQCLGAIGAVLAAALRQIVRPRHDCPPGVLRIAQSHGSKDLLGRLDALQRLRRLLSAGVHEPLALESGFLQIIAAT